MKRDARIKAMQILYTCDFQGLEIKDVLEMEEELDELAISLAELCYANLSRVDELISSTLERYTIDRLNLVDKAIIRLAVSEMLAGKEPRQVIINEALEITKLFTDMGDHKAVSFNNRLLDNINKKLKVE
ncbi:MAG: transcription antitermination factor NusB [Anaeroplasmataceae bacterium]|nr:transcription antitermination factor NusB [Anaeroplasmataceae bacterium]